MTILSFGAGLLSSVAKMRSGAATALDGSVPSITDTEFDYPFLQTHGLQGGGFVTSWAYDLDRDGTPDGIAIQRIASDGSADGPTIRTGAIKDLIDLSSDDETVNGSIEALADGGYALAYVAAAEKHGGYGMMTATIMTALGQYALFLNDIGKPLSYYIGFAPEGTQFYLLGQGGSGAKAVPVQVIDGRIAVTQALLDEFINDTRIVLGATGPGGAALAWGQVNVFSESESSTYDPASGLVTETPTLSQTTSNNNGSISYNYGYSSNEGRAEAFHFTGIDPAAVSQVTLQLRVADPYIFLMAIGAAPDTQGLFTDANGVGYNIFHLPGDAGVLINIIGLNGQPLHLDAAGNLSVPATVLAALGSRDAVINANLTFSAAANPATPPVASVDVREAIEHLNGFYLQLLDAVGQPQGDPVRIDSPAAPVDQDTDGGPAQVNLDTRADGRLVASWEMDTDGDGNGDAIGVQVLEADGTKVGSPVTLTGFDPHTTAYQLDALPDGKLVVSTSVAPDMVYSMSGLFAQPDGSYVVFTGASRPVEYQFSGPWVASATFQLNGHDAAGNAVSITVVPDADGNINVTRSILANFAADSRLSLTIETNEDLAGQYVFYTGQQIWSYPAGGATHAQSMSGIAAGDGYLNLNIDPSRPGLLKSIDLGSYTFAPGAAQVITFYVVPDDLGQLASQLGLQPMQPTGISGATYMWLSSMAAPGAPDLLAVTVPLTVDGKANVPALVLTALQGHDAIIVASLSNLVAGTTVTATAIISDPVELQDGLFLHYFNADGTSAGDPLHIDTDSLPMPLGDEEEASAARFDVDVRDDGSVFVSWATDADGDRYADGIAVQHVGADGQKLGDPVVLQNIAPEILAAIGHDDDDEVAASIDPLDGGGFVLSVVATAEENWTEANAFVFSNGKAYASAIGKTYEFRINAPTSGLTLTLIGHDADGANVRIPVEAIDGRVLLTQEIWDQFGNDARITLEISGGQPMTPISVNIISHDVMAFAATNPLVEDECQFDSVTIFPGFYYAGLSNDVGRVEAFHLDAASVAALLAVTPTAADQQGGRPELCITVGDIHELGTKLGLSLFAPQMRDGCEYLLAQDGPGQSGYLIIRNVLPDANGTVTVPQAVLDALGETDAAITYRLIGPDANITLAGTVDVRLPTEFQEGLLVQTFDAAGYAKPVGIPLIEGGTIENGTSHADVSGIEDADGIVSVEFQWQRSADGKGNWLDIAGAVGEDYDVGAADRGSYLRVAVAITDTNGTLETLFSVPSEVASLEGSSDSDSLIGTTEGDFIDGLEGNDIIRGRGGDDMLFGDDGDDQIFGESGNDRLFGGLGDDGLSGGAGNDVLSGEAGIDTLNGGEGDDQLFGGGGDDVLNGDGGADTIGGGDGADLVHGGEGNDFVRGGRQADSLYGDNGDDRLYGEADNDLIDGGVGGDQMWGGAGDDTYYVDDAGDRVIETTALTGSIDAGGKDKVFATATTDLSSYNGGRYVEDVTLLGVAAINATGNGLANVLRGNDGANRLDGRGGLDDMAGGKGNDTYVVDTSGDIITESASQGIDTVEAGFTFTLATNFENLLLTGTSTIDGTGNSVNNVLTGNAAANVLTGLVGNDRLDGGAGIDRLVGGLGDDYYVVDQAGDVIVEVAGEGADTVEAWFDFTLATNLEHLVLGGSAAINGTGNGYDNRITGNDAANILDGRTGADTLAGGKGDDIYFVENVSDIVTEKSGEGTDTVRSTITLKLAGNVENLLLLGTSTIDGTGNVLANVLTGNSAANKLGGDAGDDTLDGKAGGDTMTGGKGDDRYIVDNAADSAVELAAEGTDQIEASITFALSANVERLVLTGASAINGSGNELANVLTGNAASNVLYGNGGDDALDGGAGNDDMFGGAGNDTYYVGQSADRVFETVNTLSTTDSGGTDTVVSIISYSIDGSVNGRQYVENLTLGGTSAVNGTGNALANRLIGNEGANVLSGGLGNDTLFGNGGNDSLDGGLGTDIMFGGAGDDNYIVDSALDQVYETASTTSASDTGGIDRVTSSVSYSIASTSNGRQFIENLTLSGTADINATGNELANFIVGNSGANQIIGGAGKDTLTGGAGADRFIFADGDFGGATGANADIIKDFSQAEADRIALGKVDANTANGAGTNEAFTFIGMAAFSGSAGELRYQQTGTGNTHVQGDTNGDGVADFTIALTGTVALSASDFVL